MAEALAVIGLVSSIVQFVDFGSKIVSRLNEYRKAGNDVPKTFQKISVDLPLIIDSLKRTKQQADAQEINDETARVLLPVVEACLAKVKELERVLNKALPVEGDSTWRSSKKALISVANETAVKDIIGDLKDHLQTLAHSQILNGPSPSSQISTYQKLLSLQSNPRSRHQPRFMVNFAREKNFVGREEIINEIDKRFSDRQPCVAIFGVGGVGKSQIAIEYCYRYKQNRPDSHVFWVYASNRARLTEAYRKIGKELGLLDVDNPAVDTLQLVRDWLSNEENGPWLLVVDNADDIETFFDSTEIESSESDGSPRALFRYLPESLNGSMILTTRDKRVGQRLAKSEKPINVLPFTIEDARHLLRKTLYNSCQDDNHSAALLEALDFLPMAISQAAAFIRENDITVLEYLSYMRASDKEAKDLLAETYHDSGRDPESRNSVFQTARISFECIRRQKPRAAKILSLMAVLDRQAIHNSLLREDAECDLDFATAVGTLKAFSLITEERTQGMFGMHRLIQLSTQRWLEIDGVIEIWQKRAIDVVSRLCTEDYAFTGEWKIWDSIRPHAEIVLSFDFHNEPRFLQRAIVLHRLVIHELEQGYILNADARAQDALATIEKVDAEHPKKLAIATTAATILVRQGKYKEAEKMQRYVLEHRERTIGLSHPDTLVTIADLASTLINQGKCNEAQALLQQGIETWEHSPDLETHRFRFSTYSMLGWVLEEQGKHEDAEVNIRKAIEGDKKVLGAKHPITTWHHLGLAGTLAKQNKAGEAEVIVRECLKDFEYSLGPQHTSFLICLGILAAILEHRNAYEEAEILRRRAWTGFEKSLGPDHQDTVFALACLASLLARQARFKDIEPFLQPVLRSCQKNSTSEHPAVLATLGAAATILELQNKWEESEVFRRRALRNFENLRGLESTETLYAIIALAYVLDQQNKYDEAELYLRQATLIYEDKYGPRARITLNALSALTQLLEKQFKYKEAEIVGLRAFHGYEIASGTTHPDAVLSLAHVAMSMGGQRKFEEVDAICRPLLSSYQEALGYEHTSLTTLLFSMADALANLDRYKEAEPFCRQASKGYEKTLGIEHRDTLVSLSLLAFILEKQRDLKAAEAIRRRVMEVQETVLGLDHPDTATTIYCLAWNLHRLTLYKQALALYERSYTVLQRTLGLDHKVTLACAEGIAMIKTNVRNRRRPSPRYFPRLRRLIRSVTATEEAGQGRHNISNQLSNGSAYSLGAQAA